MTPTQRSLAFVRKMGWDAAVVERWNPHARIRQDLFGCVDILCLLPNRGGVTGIQTTSGDNVSARCQKIAAEPRMVRWVRAGNGLYVHGWAKRGPRGKRKLWTCRVVEDRVKENYGSEPVLVWEEQDG